MEFLKTNTAMEFSVIHLCLLILLQVICGAADDSKVSNTYSRRLNYISSALARIARKQKTIETRLNDITDDTNKFCLKEDNQKKTLTDSINGKIKEEIDNIKKTIASGEEHLRNLEENIDGKMIASQTTSRELESRIDSIDEHIAALKASFSDKIQSVWTKIAEMETTVDFLEGKIKTMNNNIAMAVTTSDIVESKMKSILKNMDESAITTDGLKTRITSMEESIASVKGASDKRVSFSVQYRTGIDESYVTQFPKETIVRFNHVFYNDGLGYNETTGIFTVPVSGVYQFIFFVEGIKLKNDSSCEAVGVYLYVDCHLVGTVALAHTKLTLQGIQSGNAYINYFKKGQTVLIGTAKTCDEYAIVAFRTTFTGVLLY